MILPTSITKYLVTFDRLHDINTLNVTISTIICNAYIIPIRNYQNRCMS